MPRRKAITSLHVSLGEHLELDVTRAARENLVVVANSGGGKTLALRVLIESLIPHMAVVVFDTAGEFWTLCEHFDCLLVGPNGQLPADPNIAADLARFIREKGLRVVVDLSELEEEDQQLFLERFGNALLKLPKTLWTTPILVVIDEVHLFAPQEERPGSRKTVGNLTTLGRKQGIFCVVATQSLAETSKKLLGSINNRLYGRFADAPDLKRASEALGFHGRQQWATITSFEPGDFFAKGSAFVEAKPIVRGRTKSRTKSTHIDQSTHIKSRPPPASASMRALAKELSDKRASLAAAAEEEKREIEILRKRVRELEGSAELKQLRTRVKELETKLAAPLPRPQPAKTVTVVDEASVRAAFDKGWAGCLEAVKRELLPPILASRRAAMDLGDLVSSKTFMVKSQRPENLIPKTPAAKSAPVAPPTPTRSVTPRPSTPPRTKGNIVLGKGAAGRILQAVLMHSHGEVVSRSKVAYLAKIDPKNSTFRAGCAELVKHEYISYEDKGLLATDKAHDDYPDVEKVPEDREQILAFWRGKFGGAALRSYDAVVQNGGRISRADLVAQTGDTGSTLRAALATIRKTGVIDYDGDDVVFAEFLRAG